MVTDPEPRDGYAARIDTAAAALARLHAARPDLDDSIRECLCPAPHPAYRARVRDALADVDGTLAP